MFVNDAQWRDSSCEVPTLIEVSREILIRHFLPDEDTELEYETVSINENEEVFEAYVEYVDGPWRLWKEACDSAEIVPDAHRHR